LQHAYTSFNTALIADWGIIAPWVPVVIDSQNGADALPASCLRVFWAEDGIPTAQGNKTMAVIDIALRVPPVGNKPDTAQLNILKDAFDKWIGQRVSDPYARVKRLDHTVTPALYLNDMDLSPDGGWVPGDTASPGQLHASKMIHLYYRL
jgi:hypothetical protein